MKPSLLIVPETSGVIRPLLHELSQQEGMRIEVSPSYEAAIQSCSELGPPSSVLTVVDQEAPGLLELLVALDSDSEAPRVPVSVLADHALERDLPIETGHSLRLLDPSRPHEDLLPRLVPLTHVDHYADPLRRGADYLLSAILCRRSTSLDLRSKTGKQVLVEIVGGDVWNVYSDRSEAIDALEAILYEPIAEVRARPLQTIPGERQIEHPGVQALGSASRRLRMRPPAVTERASRRDFGTQEIELDAVRPELAKASRATASTTTVPSEEDATDRAFGDLLTRGIQASLARDYQGAVDAFEAALELRPDDAKAAFNLARVRQRLDR